MCGRRLPPIAREKGAITCSGCFQPELRPRYERPFRYERYRPFTRPRGLHLPRPSLRFPGVPQSEELGESDPIGHEDHPEDSNNGSGSGCNVCGFDPGDNPNQSVPFNRGGMTTLVSCARCGSSVCSHHSEVGSGSGYEGEWAGAILCPGCSHAIEEESAARWEEEFGDSGRENPYGEREEAL